MARELVEVMTKPVSANSMSLVAWIYLLVVGIAMLKADPGSKLNHLLDDPTP